MNILDLYQRMGLTAKRAASTHGGEYAGPCPRCGGTDRFRMWPEQGPEGSWFCRSCQHGENGGDAISFLMLFQGMEFEEAAETVGRRLDDRKSAKRKPWGSRPPKLPESKAAPEPYAPQGRQAPNATWTGKVEQLVKVAHKNLLRNKDQLAWLEARGIGLETVKEFRLGWVGDSAHRSRRSWGLPPGQGRRPDSLWIPAGLVIPNMRGGTVQRLRIRRSAEERGKFLPDLKYFCFPCPSSGSVALLTRKEARVWVVVEAELDGLAVHHAAGDLVGAVALTTLQAKPDPESWALLTGADKVLGALDFEVNKDQLKSLAWWDKQLKRHERWPVPKGKDPGEAAKLGVNLRTWVIAGLPPSMTSTSGPLPTGMVQGGGAKYTMVSKAVRQLANMMREHGVEMIRKDGKWSVQHPAEFMDDKRRCDRLIHLVFKDRDVARRLAEVDVDRPSPEMLEGGVV